MKLSAILQLLAGVNVRGLLEELFFPKSVLVVCLSAGQLLIILHVQIQVE